VTQVQRKIANLLVSMIKQMIHTEELKIAQLHRFGKTLEQLCSSITKGQ